MGVNTPDFDAIVADAVARRVCPTCAGGIPRWRWGSTIFDTAKCRYAFRDRRRYAENEEAEREKSRRYYEKNRETILAKAAAKRATVPPGSRVCSECGSPLEGRRVVCSTNRCRDARFKRLNPEAYATREAAKVERRRDSRRAKRGES